MVEIDENKLPDEFAYVKVIKDVDKQLFSILFKEYNGNQTLMAERLGVTRRTVRRKIAQYDIKNHD